MKHKRSSNALLCLAGLLTGAEAIVGAGIDLPMASVIPGWARALLILGVTGGAFVFRLLAQRQEGGDGT